LQWGFSTARSKLIASDRYLGDSQLLTLMAALQRGGRTSTSPA
jgi:hypothetical protein